MSFSVVTRGGGGLSEGSPVSVAVGEGGNCANGRWVTTVPEGVVLQLELVASVDDVAVEASQEKISCVEK